MSALLTQRLVAQAAIEEAPFSSKAATLAYLAPRLRTARVLPIHRLTLGAYRAQADNVLNAIANESWARGPMIVRSSARGEDSAESSEAGRYESVLNVSGIAALRVAIETVIASYPDSRAEHEILIQPMLPDAVASGVAFSSDPNTGSPYAVITIANGTDTAAVTAGRSENHGTILCSRYAKEIQDPRIRRVIALLEEVRVLSGMEHVDIEFAFDAGDALYLFQARPLVMKTKSALSDAEHRDALAQIAAQIEAKCRPHPFLRGRRTLFGVMPDWNPAEMIGIRPRPLALSLYRELITDVIWSYQRHNYGYRNLRSFPLLHDFFGLPYIDVRVSFNSFIPGDIPDRLADKLANYYIDTLAERPSLHDKVEFEIIFSCYAADIQERLSALENAGFSRDEIEILENSLRRLTNGIISNSNGLWQQDTAKLDTLGERYDAIRRDIHEPISRIYWLLEDGKRYGTLPFAGLARAAFIAVQSLRSLVTVGALREKDYHDFLGSLNTVSGQMSRDLTSLDRVGFLARYGHLRPGTYDIRSPRYDAEPDLYFNWAELPPAHTHETQAPFALTLSQMNAINRLLQEHRLEHDVVGLFNFLKAAIEGREKAKFLFTRNLSDALECLAGFGGELGFSREDLSYIDIKTISRLNITCENAAAVFGRSIEEGQKRYELTRTIALPSLIVSPSDAWHISANSAEPNFVTQLSVRGPVVREQDRERLKGAIVMIASADPGYDWLFSHGIGGLITTYGGVNSHMAIRAGELRIPAVIGAGEALFAKWASSRVLNVDCANKRVEILA